PVIHMSSTGNAEEPSAEHNVVRRPSRVVRKSTSSAVGCRQSLCYPSVIRRRDSECSKLMNGTAGSSPLKRFGMTGFDCIGGYPATKREPGKDMSGSWPGRNAKTDGEGL